MFGIYGGRVWRRAQSRATLLARAGDRCSPLLELGDRCSPLLEFPVTRIHPLSAAHPSHTINHGWQVKSQQEGARAPIAATSLHYYAALALGVDPATIVCPLAWSFRATTTSMPAHTDDDADWWTMAYYLSGLDDGPLELPGNRLFLCSGKTGGNILEVSTHCKRGDLVMGYWHTANSLHWVGSGHNARGQPSKSAVRIIPFDNKFVSERLLESSRLRAVRMCPLAPQKRDRIECTACGLVADDPTREPEAWLEHMCFAVQKCSSRPYVCLSCMHCRLG